MRVIERSISENTQAGAGASAVCFMLDLEELDDYPTDALPGFTDRLLAVLPGLDQHACPPGEPGGLAAMLKDGMGIAHLVEHVVLEVQALAGAGVEQGRTSPVHGQPGLYSVTCGCGDETVALTASRMALELVASLLPSDHRAVLGLGLLSQPIEISDADGGVAGLAALGRMVSTDHAAPVGDIDVARLDLLAPVELLPFANLLRPVAQAR